MIAVAVVDDDDDSAAADPSFPSTAERGSIVDALVDNAVAVAVDTAADDAVKARCCVLGFLEALAIAWNCRCN